MKSEHWRVFFAVTLHDDVRQRISEYLARFQSSSPASRLSWTDTRNLHITLKFIGAINPGRVAALSLAASRSVQNAAPFYLTIEGSGVFPPKGPPRILWLGVSDPSGALAAIQTNLEQQCIQEGFAGDDRPFHAHVTIARLRASGEARQVVKTHRTLSLEPAHFLVNELALMRSEPGNSGSQYTGISVHRLLEQ